MRIVTEDELDTDIKPIGEEAEDEKFTPRVPDIGMDDDEVESLEFEYSTRALGDYVVSGPLGSEGTGPGHRFNSVHAALIWLTRRIGGKRIKQRITEAEPYRWAFLVRPPQEKNGK